MRRSRPCATSCPAARTELCGGQRSRDRTTSLAGVRALRVGAHRRDIGAGKSEVARGGWRPTARSSSTRDAVARGGAPARRLAEVVAEFGHGRRCARRHPGPGPAGAARVRRRVVAHEAERDHPSPGRRAHGRLRRAGRGRGVGHRPRRPAARREPPRGQLRRGRGGGRRPAHPGWTRLARARGMSRAQAEARMRAQASREERLAIATIVVDNSGSLARLDREVGD